MDIQPDYRRSVGKSIKSIERKTFDGLKYYFLNNFNVKLPSKRSYLN